MSESTSVNLRIEIERLKAKAAIYLHRLLVYEICPDCGGELDQWNGAETNECPDCGAVWTQEQMNMDA